MAMTTKKVLRILRSDNPVSAKFVEAGMRREVDVTAIGAVRF